MSLSNLAMSYSFKLTHASIPPPLFVSINTTTFLIKGKLIRPTHLRFPQPKSTSYIGTCTAQTRYPSSVDRMTIATLWIFPKKILKRYWDQMSDVKCQMWILKSLKYVGWGRGWGLVAGSVHWLMISFIDIICLFCFFW